MIIVFEMSNDYKLIIPLMMATVLATLLAEHLHKESIYTLKLKLKGITLQRGRDVDVLQAVTVGEVISRDFDSVNADATLEQLSDRFTQTHRHGFPILDAEGKLCGVVTISDLDRAVSDQLPDNATALDIGIPRKELLVATPNESVGVALARMGTRGLGRLPVVADDDPNQLLGLIRRADIIRAYDIALSRRADLAIPRQAHLAAQPGRHRLFGDRAGTWRQGRRQTAGGDLARLPRKVHPRLGASPRTHAHPARRYRLYARRPSDRVRQFGGLGDHPRLSARRPRPAVSALRVTREPRRMSPPAFITALSEALGRAQASRQTSADGQDFLSRRPDRAEDLESAIRIFFEFLYGYESLEIDRPCVTVFGSARFAADHPYALMAYALGGELARAGYAVMTGGGPGIMQAANRGAYDVGGLSIGCSVKLDFEPGPNPYINHSVEFDHFFVRKAMMVKYSCAFVVLPGGFGTLDEVFETLTLIKRGNSRLPRHRTGPRLFASCKTSSSNRSSPKAPLAWTRWTFSASRTPCRRRSPSSARTARCRTPPTDAYRRPFPRASHETGIAGLVSQRLRLS